MVAMTSEVARRPRVLATLLVLVPLALVFVPAGLAHPTHPAEGHSYTVLQMNLCLSGRAHCFHDTHYPMGVHEAIQRITDNHPDAVTVDEVCSRDVADMASVSGYHVRFSPVRYVDSVLACQDPGGRGDFGIAVLTRQRITDSAGAAFDAQDGIEQRRWLCVTTTDSVTVCATHLSTRGWAATRAVNDAQCGEFAHVLAARQSSALVAGGDMNRPDPCAAPGMWAQTDTGATQAAGRQQVYGDDHFEGSTAQVIPMVYTDHDALVVTSTRAG
jgi:endonuclease/exonuclease/phosphatase family metal-dependent hydrolase